MPHKGSSMHSDRRVIALLPEGSECAGQVRAGLSGIAPRVQLAADLSSVVEIVRSAEIDLVVCDDRLADPRMVFAGIADAARGRASGTIPLLVTIVSPGEATAAALEEEPAFAHYIARPFRAETLAALCRSLVEGSTAPLSIHQDDPTIRVRHPARFSARPLYADAVAFARESFVSARDGRELDMARGRLVAERLHTSLLQSNLLLNRALEPYKRFEIPTHCANVAILGGKIALSRELPLRRLLRVIQAGLLHDIGMARLPQEVLVAEGGLTQDARTAMQNHPVLGAEIIAELEGDYEWLERAIREEHERLDGSGYPDGLAGDGIDETARILGVADVFEAFSHARTYRSPFTAFEALERVMQMRADVFDASIVDALANEISVFPLDSYVRLSSGTIGRVVATNPDNLMRPTIEVLWDANWAPIDPEILSLDEAPDVAVERPLHESEIPIT